LASRDLGIEKPNPLIFQRAIELAAADARTGILPREALHVGDHIKKDYEAARVSRRMKLNLRRIEKIIAKFSILKTDYGNSVAKRHGSLNAAIFFVLVDEISLEF
jgi:hypothetical protein